MATTTKKRTKRITTKDNGHKNNAKLQQLSRLQDLATVISRTRMAAALGQSYDSDRDLYTALGYKKSLIFADFEARYKRQDIAGAIVDAPANESWRLPPEITESEDEDTPFEQAWIEHADRLGIWNKFLRVDSLSGIGRYGALLIGFNDGAELSEEVTRASDVLYLMPYSEDHATIKTFDDDPRSERYGLPLVYQVSTSIGESLGSKAKSSTINVHWSRIIHIAENAKDNEVFGTPRLERCFNRLEDLERIIGGGAEMFWRGAFPGLSLNIDPEATVTAQELDDLTDELEDYLHSLKRYIRTQGVNVQQLAPMVADPRNHVDVILDMISSATRIPKRILIGSERGELASTQDETAWMKHIEGRRANFCEQQIIRPYIGRCIDAGVFSEPADGYTAEWPDLMTASDKDKAEVGEIKSRSLAHYANAVGAQDIVPPDVFLEHYQDFTKDQIEEINDRLDEMEKEEDKDSDEEQAVIIPPFQPTGEE